MSLTSLSLPHLVASLPQNRLGVPFDFNPTSCSFVEFVYLSAIDPVSRCCRSRSHSSFLVPSGLSWGINACWSTELTFSFSSSSAHVIVDSLKSLTHAGVFSGVSCRRFLTRVTPGSS